MFKFFSPLEQFSILEKLAFMIRIKFLGISLFFDFSVTVFLIENLNNILIISLLSLINIFWIGSGLFWSWNFFISIYNFVFNVTTQIETNEFIHKYFILVFSVFILLLSNNLLGLIPYSFVPTAHLGQNFFLSSSLIIYFTILGFFYLKWHFIYLFVPWAPILMLPFLFIIELISYIAWAFSLSIRLFANLMSGHTLLYILCAFSSLILTINLFGFVILSILIFLIFGLEIVIAAMQAYVFIVLLCVYLKDSTSESTH